MSAEHVTRIGWAGYLRKAVCSCGWEGRRWKDATRPALELARHLAEQQPAA